jgi:hypothetical protein
LILNTPLWIVHTQLLRIFFQKFSGKNEGRHSVML